MFKHKLELSAKTYTLKHEFQRRGSRMKKFLVLIPTLFTLNAFALDQDIMTLVHTKTRETLTEICQEKMKQLSAGTCACLGEKAQANINDSQLSQCPNKGAKTCVKKIVEVATIMALSKDSVTACMHQSGQGAPDTATPEPTSSTTTEPASAAPAPAPAQPPLSPNPEQKPVD